jgi:flagellar motor switch protein FliG
MSDRAGKLLKDDMEALGPVRLRDVDDAQANIVGLAKELAASGQIEIAESKDEEMVV